uniref:Uncharacterized protein n=1 Tax=Arundo donax TaxID=35708 RepID=A0A0A9GLZ3_ARUDO
MAEDSMVQGDRRDGSWVGEVAMGLEKSRSRAGCR